MKIIRVETFLTHAVINHRDLGEIPAFLLVCLETDQGHKVWGESFVYPDHEADVESLLLSMGQQIIAKNITDPVQFHRQHKALIEENGFNYACAMSGIEIALWDLQGKTLEQPVYQLIGKPLLKQIPVYANTWGPPITDIATLVIQCQSLVEDGYKAIKLYPLKYGSAEKAGECLKKVRNAVGDGIDIMIDISAITDPELALACASAIAPHHPYWFEEPHSGDDLETLAEIRRKSGLPIVTGEKHAGQSHFKKVLQLDAADILNPDISGCGGILETLEIAQLAENCSVKLSPHCWNSMTVALAAMLQVCAVMPNSDKAEVFPGFLEFGQQFCRSDFTLTNGELVLGNAPGLGIDIDINALRQISLTQVIS